MNGRDDAPDEPMKVTQRVWPREDKAGAVHVPNQVSGFAKPKADAGFTLSGVEKEAVDMGRDRLALVALAFMACFAVLALRLLDRRNISCLIRGISP